MRKPESFGSLENLGRVRLSRTFFMRDFLYSEISNFYGVPNLPEDPDLAIENGKRLCEEILEPLQATFGRLAIRSAYRSPAVNQLGNEKGHNCGSNESNYAAHIWDRLDKDGCRGAMACVVVPWFIERYKVSDWRSMAYWIHNNLPYSQVQFFSNLCAFNIGWHERPARRIESFIPPRTLLARGEERKVEWAQHYEGFPALRREAALDSTEVDSNERITG